MKRAFGSDRLIHSREGRLILFSPLDKGWTGRTARRHAHAQFPGTCVQWDEDLFEVVLVERLPSGVRYTLMTWSDPGAIRVFQSYTEESEIARAADARDVQTRVRRRHLSIFASLLAGHLPARVQQRLQDEYGVSAGMMTLVSIIPMFTIGVASVLFFVARSAGAPVPVPKWMLLIGMFVLVESCVRFAWTFPQSNPIGSVAGFIIYEVWALATGERITGRGEAARSAIEAPVDQDQQERDAYLLREPLLALLSSAEQRLFVERFGFDPIRWGRRTAIMILLVSAVGFFSSIAKIYSGRAGIFTILSLLMAGFLVAEQIYRWRTLSRGEPAGSILAFFARPLVRGL